MLVHMHVCSYISLPRKCPQFTDSLSSSQEHRSAYQMDVTLALALAAL